MKMKKFSSLLLLVATLMVAMTSMAQTTKTGKPGISGGLLGALNYTQFRTNTSNIDYKNDLGWAAGLYLNIPLSTKWSLEAQGQWSTLKYNVKSQVGTIKQFAGTMQYQSYPILLKYQTSKNFALLGGVQVDFLNTIKNDAGGGYYKRNFIANSNAATVGFELFPTKTVQIYGRYIYGLSDMKYDQNPNVGKLGHKFYNDGFQFGVKVKLFGKKAVPPVVPVVAAAPVDTDSDGVVDSLDKCPTVPGVAKYQGCPVPDTDKDGVNDEQDKCPTVPGLAKYAGCPVPDTDKDGVNDEQDKCPTVPGLAKYAGCPIPDTDGDGVNDEQDKCPNEAGVASNYGCPDMTPVLNEAAKSFYFVINTAKLVDAKIAKSKFDPVLDLLAKYPKLQLEIQGNTDITGNDKINMPLSQKRADAVKKAFLDKGISADRLTTVANGSSKPKADNKTKAGRKENRNVTLVPSFKD